MSRRPTRATSISFEGPFFTHDPKLTFRQNIRTMMAALAAEGEKDVRTQMPNVSGRSRSVVRGRVKSMRGTPWQLTAVVSSAPDDREAAWAYPWGKHGSRGGPTRGQAIYRGGRLEARYHMFRTTASRLRRARAVNAAELTKGLT